MLLRSGRTKNKMANVRQIEPEQENLDLEEARGLPDPEVNFVGLPAVQSVTQGSTGANQCNQITEDDSEFSDNDNDHRGPTTHFPFGMTQQARIQGGGGHGGIPPPKTQTYISV